MKTPKAVKTAQALISMGEVPKSEKIVAVVRIVKITSFALN